MQLIETVIDQDAIRLRYADHKDRDKAKKWIEFQLPLAELRNMNLPNAPVIASVDDLYVPELKHMAWRNIRDFISGEIQRLQKIYSH